MMVTAHTRLRLMASGFWVSRALSASFELRLYDQLQQRSCTPAELHELLEISDRGVEILLRFNLAFGLLIQDDDGTLSIAREFREYLNPNCRSYFAPTATIANDVWKSFETLSLKIKDGISADEYEYFDSLTTDEARGFYTTMASQAASSAADFAQRIDVSGVKTLLDIGCGPAVNSIELAKSNQSLKLILFDTPQMLTFLKKDLAGESEKLCERVFLVEGDFNQDLIEAGYDGVLLSKIFHDWDDQRCIEILKRFVEPMPVGGKLFIHEEIIQTKSHSDFWPSLIDLFLFCRMGRGRTRTIADYNELLSAIDFEVRSVSAVDEHTAIITAGRRSC